MRSVNWGIELKSVLTRSLSSGILLILRSGRRRRNVRITEIPSPLLKSPIHPVMTTRTSSRFHESLKYEFSQDTNPIAKIFNIISIVKTIRK